MDRFGSGKAKNKGVRGRIQEQKEVKESQKLHNEWESFHRSTFIVNAPLKY